MFFVSFSLAMVDVIIVCYILGILEAIYVLKPCVSCVLSCA